MNGQNPTFIQTMKIWQVLLLGEGFQVEGAKSNCEITGFVEAESVEAAIEKACAIATRAHPELAQVAGPFPRPVVNADEVEELGATFPYSVDVDQVELHWVAVS